MVLIRFVEKEFCELGLADCLRCPRCYTKCMFGDGIKTLRPIKSELREIYQCKLYSEYKRV